MTESSTSPQWVFVLIPKVTNLLYDTLKKVNKQTSELGWVKKFTDLTFLGSSTTDQPLKNMLDKERFKKCVEYSMKRTIKSGEPVPFRVVEGITPMVSPEGMGLILDSPFLTHMAVSMGFTPNKMFFLVLAASKPESRWSEEMVRAGIRMFEDPEDGQFRCEMHPSQWSLGVLNVKNPELMYAVFDLEAVIPEIYVKIEMERQTTNLHSTVTVSTPSE